MENKEHLLSAIRFDYSLIYNWLKNNGMPLLKKHISENSHWTEGNNTRLLEYEGQIKKMPSPEDADLEQMNFVAGQVVYGIFEIYFGQMAGEFMLGEIGRHIQDSVADFKKIVEKEALQEYVFDVTDHVYRTDESYFESAGRIYSEVFIDPLKNLGGRVALADTNWEIQKRAPNTRRTLFRKAAVLNLGEIDEEGNLFQLTLNDQISIISITVK